MPRKKISIEEAFSALEAAGVYVQVKTGPSVDVLYDKTDVEIFEPTPQVTNTRKVGSKSTKITLYAAHTVGSGGSFVGSGSDRHIENNGVVTYGPGVITVPNEIAAHLLHQDSLARKADRDMLDPTFKSFLIVEKKNASGISSNVGIPVDDLYNLLNLPDSAVYRIS